VLTRSGLGAVVATVVLAVLGMLWNYEELVLASMALALVVVLALLIAQRPLRATVERRITSVRVQRGDPLPITHRVRNDTRHRSGRATVIDRCDEAEIEVTIDPVAAGDVTDIMTPITTRRRGVFELGPLDVRKIDPFSLAVGRWRDDKSAARPQRVTVHPKVYPLVGPQGEARVVENESVVRRAATDPMSGFVSMRDYVPGDDPRLIHWPTTARTGSLMIRENVEVRRPEFTVVVDTGMAVGTDDDFEEIVDVAASLAVHALRAGLDVVVRTTDHRHPGRRLALQSESQVLDLLTMVGRTAERAPLPMASLFGQGLSHSSVLLITGPSGPTSRMTAGDQMLTIRVGDGAQAGGDIAFAAANAADFVSKWRSWV
jgi:uncharacterized protein (DUF58 family)